MRQHDTAAVARNFAESGMFFFLPEVDWTGAIPGYAEMEFPIFSYLVAVLYRVFGVQEWFGRALNIALFALSAWILFIFVRRVYSEFVAVLAVFFYTFVPLGFLFTRTFQPDVLAALASLSGVYFFWRWTEAGRLLPWACSAAGIALAILIKPLNIYLGLPLLYLSFLRFGWRCIRQPMLWVFAFIVIAPAAAWYAHSHSLWERFGTSFFQHYVLLPLAGRYESLLNGSLFKVLFQRIWLLIASPPGLLLLLLGALTRKKEFSVRNWVFNWWAAAFFVSVLLVPHNHWGHAYYQLPILFVTSVWMALGVIRLWSSRWKPVWVYRWSAVLLTVAVAVVTLWKIPEWTRDSSDWIQRREFGRRVEAMTQPGSLLITIEPQRFPRRSTTFEHRTKRGELLWGYPYDLYYSHRKGWSLSEHEATPRLIESLREQGATYLITFFPEALSRHPETLVFLRSSHQTLEDSRHGLIFRLQSPPD